MSTDYTAETGDPVTNTSGTYRVRVEYDPEGCGNPRGEDCNNGTMVLSHNGYTLPREGDLIDRIDEAFERGGLPLAVRYLRVVHDAVVLPVYGYDHGQFRLKAGARTYPFDDKWDSGVAGLIYARRADIAKEWEGHKVPSDDDIALFLTSEVETYDIWANGEMTGYLVERQCPECESWEIVDSCWGYYSVSEAMEQGTLEIPDDGPNSICSTCLATLTDDERAIIAGLLHGALTPDPTWERLRLKFPIELFRTWAAAGTERSDQEGQPG